MLQFIFIILSVRIQKLIDSKPLLFIYLQPTRFCVLGFLENWCGSIVFRGNPLMVDQLSTRHSFRLRLKGRRRYLRVSTPSYQRISLNSEHSRYDILLIKENSSLHNTEKNLCIGILYTAIIIEQYYTAERVYY